MKGASQVLAPQKLRVNREVMLGAEVGKNERALMNASQVRRWDSEIALGAVQLQRIVPAVVVPLQLVPGGLWVRPLRVLFLVLLVAILVVVAPPPALASLWFALKRIPQNSAEIAWVTPII